MSLESASYISDLNSANPSGGDAKAQGDDHIRLIKAAVKASFPNIAGAMNLSHDQLNLLDSKLLAVNGYQKFPSGFVVQWGGGTTTGAGIASVTFPIAFPAAMVAYALNTATVNGTVRSVGSSATGIDIEVRSGGAVVSGSSVTWIAVGY